MKIFKDTGYAGNINYLDKNGFAVGWGGGDDCCAVGGEFFSKVPKANGEEIENFNPENYSFNQAFFEELEDSDRQDDSGGTRAFELINDNDPNDKVYLIVYNWHNGYYSTSLEVKKDDKLIRDENL